MNLTCNDNTTRRMRMPEDYWSGAREAWVSAITDEEGCMAIMQMTKSRINAAAFMGGADPFFGRWGRRIPEESMNTLLLLCGFTLYRFLNDCPGDPQPYIDNIEVLIAKTLAQIAMPSETSDD